MKRLLLFATLALAALTMRAQNPNGYNLSPVPSDSVSVLLRHLADTNKEVAYINDCLRLHSQLALGSFALEGIGVACLLLSSPVVTQGLSDMDPLAKLGVGFCVVGGIGFICSYIPIWTQRVRLDGHGLVISL